MWFETENEAKTAFVIHCWATRRSWNYTIEKEQFPETDKFIWETAESLRRGGSDENKNRLENP
jgi:hypothetical protein